MIPIPGHPRYSISESGEIFSHVKNRFLTGYKNGQGYVRFVIDGKEFMLHRLLALSFIPNPQNLPVVRHLDDDRDNNSLSNLAWGTLTDNNRDMVRNGHHVHTKKTHCPEGHDYTIKENGKRFCKICTLKWFQDKRKEALSDEFHGTRTGYVYGCRCEACMYAEKEYQRTYRLRVIH